jgi:hypothetical protein
MRGRIEPEAGTRRQRGGDESEGARPRPRSAPSRSSSRAPHDPPGEAKKRISKASRRGGGGGRQQRSLVLAPPSSSLSGSPSSPPPLLLSIARPQLLSLPPSRRGRVPWRRRRSFARGGSSSSKDSSSGSGSGSEPRPRGARWRRS